MAAVAYAPLQLDKSEADALADAIANVQRHYPAVKLLSDKHMALAGLGMVASRIYGKRILGVNAPPADHVPVKPLNVREVVPPAAPDAAENVSSWFAPPPEGHMN